MVSKISEISQKYFFKKNDSSKIYRPKKSVKNFVMKIRIRSLSKIYTKNYDFKIYRFHQKTESMKLENLPLLRLSNFLGIIQIISL